MLTHHLPDHCLHASMETKGPLNSASDTEALSVLFLVGLAFASVAFFAAVLLAADVVFAMMQSVFLVVVVVECSR